MKIEDLQDSSGKLWVIYPPSKQVHYSNGDLVYVNLHTNQFDGAGVVISDGKVTEGKWKDRYQCQFDSDGSIAHVNPKRLYPRFPFREFLNMPIVVLTSETDHYRELARSCVNRSDFAIDIGSSAGVCTHRLSQMTNNVIGFDISEELISKSKADFPCIPFYLLDILSETDKFLEIAQNADVVFADIGGDRDFKSMSTVLNLILSRMNPRLIVVKNREMVQSAANHMGRRVKRSKGSPMLIWEQPLHEITLGGDVINFDNSATWWTELVVNEPQQWINSWQK